MRGRGRGAAEQVALDGSGGTGARARGDRDPGLLRGTHVSLPGQFLRHGIS